MRMPTGNQILTIAIVSLVVLAIANRIPQVRALLS